MTQPAIIDFAASLEAFISLPATDEDEAQFNRLALQLFALQFEHNPTYGNLCKSRHALPGIVEHWTEIPSVPVSAFKDFEMTCLTPDDRTTYFQSSGTTNLKPSRHFHSTDSLSLYETSLKAFFLPHLHPDFPAPLRYISLTPPPDSAPHSSLVHMFSTVTSKQYDRVFFGQVEPDGSWCLDFTSLHSTLASADESPVALLGTAFLFVNLLDALAGDSLPHPLPPGSRAMETGGYKGRTRELSKPDLHRLISSRLGIHPDHIVTEYGMTELNSQAYDRAVGQEPGYYKFPHWARARVLSPETGLEVANGEPGLITIVDLANMASVLALQTEDLGIRHEEEFEWIGRTREAEPRGCSLTS